MKFANSFFFVLFFISFMRYIVFLFTKAVYQNFFAHMIQDGDIPFARERVFLKNQ